MSEIEDLLDRYQPADPRPELADLVGGARIRRTWPWAVAAAALLAITIGLHAAARTAAPPTTPDVAQLAARLGGDEVAWHVASFLASEPRPADAATHDPFEDLR